MRSLFLFIALLLVACGKPQTTDRILADVWQRDQAIRHQMMELTRAPKLDSLRVSVGLSPIAAYLEVLTQTTGVEAKFDPQITVEELNALREE